MTLQNYVRETRLEKDITQEKLAQIVGVSRQTIIAIEKGNYVPSLLLAMELSKVLNKPIERLFIAS